MTKAQSRKRAATESVGFLLIVGAILVVLNILGTAWFERVDATEDELFSLSEGSERLAESLEDQMVITGYFTEELPPPFNATARYVRDLLAEYAAASEGHIKVQFIDPETSDEQQEAEQAGVRRVAHQVAEEEGLSVREGYRGIVVEYLGEQEAIPVVQDTTGLEYRLTSMMKKMTGKGKRPVGIVEGHGGPSLSKGLTRLGQIIPSYEFQHVSVDSPISQELAILLIIGPEEEFTDAELKNIDQYVMKGGSLGVFGGNVGITLEGMGPTASTHQTNLDKLLGKWGIELGEGLVADAQCGRAPMQTAFGFQVAVPYPPVPVVALEDESHPVAFRLDSAPIPFASNLKVKPQGGGNVTVLANSSDRSWLLTGDTISLRPREPREWQIGETVGPFPLIAAIEGKLPSAFSKGMSSSEGDAGGGMQQAEVPVRVLVSGSSAMLRDELLPQPQQGQAQQLTSTIALGLNALDWLARDDDLIAIRAKDVEAPALEVPSALKRATEKAQEAAQIQDEQQRQAALEEVEEDFEKAEAETKLLKQTYKYSNMIGLPLLFALFGIGRWRYRQTKKRRMKI